MSERITVRSLFVATRPRRVLGSVLDVLDPYTSEIAAKPDAHPGSKMTARVAARVLIPKYGRERAALILLDSLEERHPDEFAVGPEKIPPREVLERIGPDAVPATADHQAA